jgi:hypothetical protein
VELAILGGYIIDMVDKSHRTMADYLQSPLYQLRSYLNAIEARLDLIASQVSEILTILKTENKGKSKGKNKGKSEEV